MEKITVSKVFSEFLKLIQSYGDVIITNSRNFNDGRMMFKCHIMSSARMADLMFICFAVNLRGDVYSNDCSELGELPDDSFKRLVWTFSFRPHSEDMKFNGKIMPMELLHFYIGALRDIKKKKLISEQEIAYFENFLEKIESTLRP